MNPNAEPSPTARGARSSPRQRRKDARPHELIDAALALFAEKGFAATRSEEVAQRAGVSKGTLYLYYPSKEALLRAVIRERLSAEIAEVAGRVARHPGTPAEMLLELLPDWWQRVFDSPSSAVFKLIITEVRNFPEIASFYAAEVVEPGTRLIGEAIARGIEVGEFRPVDVQASALSLVLPLVMLCVHKHSISPCMPPGTVVDAPRFIRQHVELVVQGLRVGAPGIAGRLRGAAT